jgi:hypothetical protein
MNKNLWEWGREYYGFQPNIGSLKLVIVYHLEKSGEEVCLAAAALRDDYVEVKGSPRVISQTKAS